MRLPGRHACPCILCLQNGEAVVLFAEGLPWDEWEEPARPSSVTERACDKDACNQPSPPSLLSQRIGCLALVMDDRFHGRGERTRTYVRKGMEYSSPIALSLFLIPQRRRDPSKMISRENARIEREDGFKKEEFSYR